MNEAKTIKEQIGFLIELQVIDGEIYTLNREKESLPGKIKAAEELLETKKSGIKELGVSLTASQVRLKDKEIELQQKEEQVKKLDGQLFQLKTNKEYSAMLKEIEGVKADSSLVEDQIIKLMDEIDATKKKIIEEKGLFKEKEKDTQREKDAVNARLKEIDSRLSELLAKRDKIVPNLEAKTLARYERVLKNKDGLAMVPVEDGACGGCHMNLPPQIISEVKLREGIVVCGSCLRILYIDGNVEIN